jgi:hypothetical protein
MTRAGLRKAFPPKRVYWVAATLLLPFVNPALLLLVGSGAQGVMGGALAILVVGSGNGVVLWWLAERAWLHEPRSRAAALLSSVLIVPALSVAFAFLELVVLYVIAAANCPPDAYECPV